MFKRFMRSNAVQFTIGALIAGYMVLIKYTTRWEVERRDIAAPVIGNGKGLIALTWHSRFLMLNSAWKKNYQPPHVLISLSRDGGVVAHTTRLLGLKTIRGSASKSGRQKAKGGSRASRAILEAVDNGGCIVITPDGPRGPRQHLGIGPLRLAKLTGCPILPCTFAVKNRIQFKSWDRFIWPLPLGRGKIIWGTPVRIPPDADECHLETVRGEIESEMNMFLAQADRDLGHEPTRPAA